MTDTFISAYEDLIGSENVDTTVDPPVLLPPDEHLLSEIVRCAASEKHKIAVAGNGTFLTPRTDHNTIMVSTSALSSVKEVNPEDLIVRAQAGAIIDDVEREANDYNLLVPLDITSGDKATVGGAYMSGAVGLSVPGYGLFRESVIGVRCITAEGDRITGGGRTTKNVTGYDITRFLAGTMGLYAIAYELIIKARPVSETQLVVLARFHSGSNPFRVLMETVSPVKSLTMYELIAPDGLGEEMLVGVGIEGMESIVQKDVALLQDKMNTCGAETVCVKDRKTFIGLRRKSGRMIVDSGFYTVSVPPSSSVVLMEKIYTLFPEMPVVAHPAIGRFHLVCHEAEEMRSIRETVLAVGGKHPIRWGQVAQDGISGLFTKAELMIARSLKRELDPLNLLNPQLKLL